MLSIFDYWKYNNIMNNEDIIFDDNYYSDEYEEYNIDCEENNND